MGEAKKSYFKGLKGEFKKIIWPNKEAVGKRTVAVILITIFLGALIKLLDFFIQYGVDFIA